MESPAEPAKRMRVSTPPLPQRPPRSDSCSTGSSTPDSPTPSVSSSTTTTAAATAETPRAHAQDQFDVETPRASTHSLPQYQQRKAPVEFEKWEVSPTQYRLVRILGSGSYGDVAESVDLETGQTVAIKRIHNVFDQPTDTKRILREVNILRQLDDTRLVRLLNILSPTNPETFNEVYLVFEFMKTDLAKLIAGPQYLRIQHVQFIMYQLLCGLKYMHSSQVVHRDLKPANILLNDDCTLKVCDFGLARFLSNRTGDSLPASPIPSSSSPATSSPTTSLQGTSATPTTTTTTAAGAGGMLNVTPLRIPPLQRQLTKHVVTRWYRSPEIILYQQYSTPVDIWSAGCIFAELLSMQKSSVANYQDRVPLFPGKTCFPLSCDNDRTYKDQLDQLNVIFDLIGTPGLEDIANLTEVGGYLKALPKKPAKDLALSFPGAPAEAIDLLNQMFAFNPNKRITVDHALEHEFFASIRSVDKELTASQAITSIENLKLESGLLRARLLEEIAFYHPTTATTTPDIITV
ncbi:hypothetical protein BASA81_003801 [Batrachochytrium salamandrivorans]|nr:hypothetical protein BASA81_003801 [Batrachochytrium salamandrivorans]